MLVDIVIQRTGEELPPLREGSMRYVVAANGLFLERRTAMYATSCRVDGCPVGLDPHDEQVRLHCGRLPEVLARSMLAFFRRAFHLHGGEAVLLLLFHPARRAFRWLCPRQTVRLHETWSGKWYPSTDIEFEEPASLPPGFVVLGDAHSHAEMYAYASHMDKEEEIYRDGLHIVVGRVNRPEVDLHVDFVMDRRRFHFAPEDVFADTRIQPFHQVPKAWLEKIHIQRHPYEYRQERYWQKSGEERRR